MGLRMTPGSVQLVRRSPWGQGLEGPSHARKARLEIWELPVHRVLEVAGVVRAEGL